MRSAVVLSILALLATGLPAGPTLEVEVDATELPRRLLHARVTVPAEPGELLAGKLVQLALGFQSTSRALEFQVHAFAACQLAGRSCISCHMVYSTQTRRFLGGRHPLCGMGVTSVMLVILYPTAFNARTEDSRPGPGPLTRTSRFLRP